VYNAETIHMQPAHKLDQTKGTKNALGDHKHSPRQMILKTITIGNSMQWLKFHQIIPRSRSWSR